jgi:mRNA interferase MazF
VDKLYPSEARVMFRGKPAKAMADQLTTVSRLRLVDLGGSLSGDEMVDVEQAIRIQLALR